MGRDEQEKLHKVYENSKEVQDFRKDFHERIKNLGKWSFLSTYKKCQSRKQQKGIGYRNGKISFYNRKGTENKELVNALKRNAPSKPYDKDVPLQLTVTFWNAIKQKKKWWQFKTTRPDLDNLMKNLQDYMTKLGYYTDDSQIVVLIAKKYYLDKNQIDIEIEEASDDGF